MFRRGLAVAVAALLLTACSGTIVGGAAGDASAPPDAESIAGEDAGTIPPDASDPGRDAGADAGGELDSGSAPDGSIPPDSGFAPDASVAADAGGGGCVEPKSILWPQMRYWNFAGNLDATEVAHLDSLPFDGMGINSYKAYNFAKVNFDPGHRTPGSGPAVDLAQLESELQPLAALRNVTANFVVVDLGMPPDFFDDDAAWADYIASWVPFARAANDLGWKGLFFDTEEYEPRSWADPPPADEAGRACPKFWAYKTGNPWQYADPNVGCIGVKFKSHSEDEYVAKARERGQAFMQALMAEFPGITVMFTHGPYAGLPWASYSAEAQQYLPYWMDWTLFMGFFTGMLEASAGTPARLVDGGELYDYRDDAAFEFSYQFRKFDIVDGTKVENPYVLDQDRALWPGRVGIGFGQYNLGGMAPDLWAATLEKAMVHADEYVWFYTELDFEKSDWQTPPTDPQVCSDTDPSCYRAWLEPSRLGRAAAKAARACP